MLVFKRLITPKLHIQLSCDTKPPGARNAYPGMSRDSFTFYPFRMCQVRSLQIRWHQRVKCKEVPQWNVYSDTKCAVHNHRNFTLKLQTWRMTQCPVAFTAQSALRSLFHSLHVLQVRISTVQHRTNIICKTLTALCPVCSLWWLCWVSKCWMSSCHDMGRNKW
jgi:hypothetical protein